MTSSEMLQIFIVLTIFIFVISTITHIMKTNCITKLKYSKCLTPIFDKCVVYVSSLITDIDIYNKIKTNDEETLNFLVDKLYDFLDVEVTEPKLRKILLSRANIRMIIYQMYNIDAKYLRKKLK